MTITQKEILSRLLENALRREDAAVTAAVVGEQLAAVAGSRLGFCANVAGLPPERPAFPGESLKDLARRIVAPGASPREVCLGLAAASALFPPPEGAAMKAQDLILAKGAGRRVAVVGHFPFVERLGEAFASFAVLELNPRPGDLGPEHAREVLGACDLAAVTASTLANGTLAGLLRLIRPGATVLLLGPTTPFAPALFACGIDVLAGAVATSPEAALAGIAANLPYRRLSGVEGRVMARPGFSC